MYSIEMNQFFSYNQLLTPSSLDQCGCFPEHHSGIFRYFCRDCGANTQIIWSKHILFTKKIQCKYLYRKVCSAESSVKQFVLKWWHIFPEKNYAIYMGIAGGKQGKQARQKWGGQKGQIQSVHILWVTPL